MLRRQAKSIAQIKASPSHCRRHEASVTAWPRPTSGRSTFQLPSLHPATTKERTRILHRIHPHQPHLQILRPRALHRSRRSISLSHLLQHPQASPSPSQTFRRSQHLRLLRPSSPLQPRLPKPKPKLHSLLIPRATPRVRAPTTVSRHHRILKDLVRSIHSRT